jgi:hypothetical protein
MLTFNLKGLFQAAAKCFYAYIGFKFIFRTVGFLVEVFLKKICFEIDLTLLLRLAKKYVMPKETFH